MATKSKSDWTLFWSIVALVIATISIGYCFTFILGLFNDGMFQSSRAIVRLTRTFNGGI